MSATNKNHDELIRRIDERMSKNPYDYLLFALLSECRAEIKRLTLSLKDSQALNLKFAQGREAADAEIERLNKPVRYAPMTDDDFMQIDISTGMPDPKEAWAYERNIEMPPSAALEVKP